MVRKTIGILGGVGPYATVDLFLKIIKATPAQRDQDHLRIIIDNNPQIPDRTEAILGKGPSPLPKMIETAKNLEKAGADFIVIPCTTAHYFLGDLEAEVSIPVLSMLEETQKAVKEGFPMAGKVGLVATTGTVRSRIYHKAFEEIDWKVVVPDKTGQEVVMDAIYGEEGVKAGYFEEPKKKVIKVARFLIDKGVKVILAGCTEIPLVLKSEDLSVPVLDPTHILAKAAVREAYPQD
jgi:aspartate racemase